MVFGGFAGGLAGGAAVTIVVNAVDNFSRVLGKASSKVGALASVGKAATGVLAGATAAITGLAVAAGGFAVKQFIDLESAMTGVAKTTDLTNEELDTLETRFKDLSNTIPTSAAELAGIGELAGQLGVQGVDNIEKFTKTIADISETTNLTREQAATDFARISNIMEEPIQNVDRIGASIVDLGNNLATTEAEISVFSQRIAGTGKIAGLTTSDILAIGAAFSSVGVPAERGGTAVQSVLTGMVKAAAEGGEELMVFAETAGLSAQEFADLFKGDASAAFTKFVQGLGKQGDQAFGTLEQLGLADKRLIQSFLSVAQAGNILEDSFEISSKAFEENIALTNEAEKRYATTASQMEAAGNRISNSFSDIGEGLVQDLSPVLSDLAPLFEEEILPAIQFVVQALVDFIKKMHELGVLEFGVQIIKGLFTFVGLVIKGIQTVAELINLNVQWAKVLVGKMIPALKIVGLGFISMKNNALLAWEFIKLGAVRVANFVIDIYQKMLDRAVSIINAMIRAANKIPGINISQISLSNVQLPKISTAEIEGNIANLRQQQEGIAREIVINVEQLTGMDADEIADALRKKLGDLIGTG